LEEDLCIPSHMDEPRGSMNNAPSKERLTGAERARMLAKIRSPLFWVGRLIPEVEIIDGKKVSLREVVFRYIADEHPSEKEVEGALFLARKLSYLAEQMKNRIRYEDLTRAEAEKTLDHLLGLMRAIDMLKKRGDSSSDIKLKTLSHKMDDQRRWLDFVKTLKR